MTHIPPPRRSPAELARGVAAQAPPGSPALDAALAMAAAMDAKWGPGQLVQLAGEFLTAKLFAQRAKLDQAIAGRDAAMIELRAEGMVKGWQALDRAAAEAGHKPVGFTAWDMPLPDGEVAAIVRTDAEADACAVTGRTTFTLAELGALVAALPGLEAVLEVKRVFGRGGNPRLRPAEKPSLVKPPVNWEVGDAIPF